MSSDLIKRLRRVPQAIRHEAADRLERMDELLFNIAYNNDMDGDTMRQVVRDFLEDKYE